KACYECQKLRACGRGIRMKAEGMENRNTTTEKDQQQDEQLRLRAKVFECASEGMMITAANGEIVSVNPAFTKLTGYTWEEAVGQTPRILHSGKQDRAFYINMWASIHETGSWRGEIWNKKKNGELYPEWLSIHAVKDSNGNIENY